VTIGHRSHSRWRGVSSRVHVQAKTASDIKSHLARKHLIGAKGHTCAISRRIAPALWDRTSAASTDRAAFLYLS
jgi:hypothetical protein